MKTTAKTQRATPAPAQTEPAAEWANPTSLKPWAKNPRLNDGEPVNKVAASIERFGFAAPIVARRETREIIAGHTRWKAAQKLGLERVPVRFLDVSESEAHLLALADNRLGELADWDDSMLREALAAYSVDDALLAGWDSTDLLTLEPDEPKPRSKPKDDNHCPNCGRYMSARLMAAQRKRAAGAQ
jgi:hypothetical protein